ncbi:MAG: hypothetical protein ACK57E_07420 [Erythrobacteraceae bacterium]|jgi:hypothetical protein
MLKLDRATASRRIRQKTFKGSIVFSLAKGASSQLFDEHRKIICDDQVDFEVGPSFRHECLLSSLARADQGWL